MRYIPLIGADKKCLEKWIEKSNEILKELKAEPDARKRKAIIKKHQKHWREQGLIDFLLKLSDGKCWYTETKLIAEYPHLEHFRPKSYARNEDGDKCHEGYWWLAFDIDNYRLSKPLPNTCKGTYFPIRERALAVCEPGTALTRESPLFLDPTVEGDAELLSFNALGQPEPCPEPVVDLDEWDHKRIEFSIKRYGLDDVKLCDERKELWVSITAQFEEYVHVAKTAKSQNCLVSRGKAEQLLNSLQSYLSPDQPFTNLIKACFSSHAVGKSLLLKLAKFSKAA